MSNRTRNIILIVSLTINLLVVGAVVGFVIRGGGHAKPPQLNQLMRQLDAPTRQQLKPQLEQHFQQMRPMRREMLAAQRELSQAILIEPFDEDRVRAALANLHTRSTNLQDHMHEQLVLVLRHMSVSERKQAVRMMRRGNRRGEARQEGTSPP